MRTKKAICIKDGIFDYNIECLEVKKGEYYNYFKIDNTYNIQDKNNEILYYPIIGFNKYFKDLSDLRKEKINKLLNDTCDWK